MRSVLYIHTQLGRQCEAEGILLQCGEQHVVPVRMGGPFLVGRARVDFHVSPRDFWVSLVISAPVKLSTVTASFLLVL